MGLLGTDSAAGRLAPRFALDAGLATVLLMGPPWTEMAMLPVPTIVRRQAGRDVRWFEGRRVIGRSIKGRSQYKPTEMLRQGVEDAGWLLYFWSCCEAVRY